MKDLTKSKNSKFKMATQRGVEVLAALRQELNDFKSEMIARLGRIESQTLLTNGKVAQNITNIELLKLSEKNCPAKIYSSNETKAIKHSRNALYITVFINIWLLVMNAMR